MPLPSPDLDDRTFAMLVEEARQVVTARAPGWTDLSAGDPGITLLEAFAYLADTTIFRLNQVPDKLYVEFLRLIGARIQPPAAAVASLVFSRAEADAAQPLELPRGTRVTVAGSTSPDAPVFQTVDPATFPAGATSVTVDAIHARLVQGELLSVSTGRAGQSFTVRQPPIIAGAGFPLDLVVGVELAPGDPAGQGPEFEHEGRAYRGWREVRSFANLGDDREAWIADRTAGLIQLADSARVLTDDTLTDGPRALGRVPRLGRQVRAWYRTGGGIAGNVVSGALSVLMDPIPGVNVTNPAPASGGRDVETLANALTRAPQELFTLDRAVTARDFQLITEATPGIARGRAFTQAALWRYATPGTVELVLVPALPDPKLASGVTAEQLVALQTPATLDAARRAVDDRRSLGTRCVVDWARYKSVRVRATVSVEREEDAAAVRQRVDERLHQTINPLGASEGAGGWPFGQALYASEVYRIVLAEAGVRHVRDVRLLVDEVPGRDVLTLEADAAQPSTWYAGSGGVLFRSLNDGDGWEAMGRFGDQLVQAIRVHPERPGLVAVATAPGTGDGSAIHVSFDSGDTWPFSRRYGFRVEDAAWLVGDPEPVLLMATGPSAGSTDGSGGGLYRLGVAREDDLVQVLVDAAEQDVAFWAVVAIQEVRGEVAVVCAAQGRQVGGQRRFGLYLSNDAGRAGSFRQIGLATEDARVLAVQRDGPRTLLWAGTAAPGGDQAGHGCFRRELLGREDSAGGWEPFATGWTAGSCWALGFAGGVAYAATQQVGVLRLDTSAASPAWVPPTVDSGLPARDLPRFQPVNALAIDPGGSLVMAGGP
ncbi:MAG: putative baseplate assembly protein, partial [Candidatus Limnocylindrales bacterium]